MGFDKESILAGLLYDIEFCPYSISIANKLSVIVFSLGISMKEEIDKKTLKDLYNSGFLNPYSLNTQNSVQTFWDSFADSLDFNYKELQNKLAISLTTINMAKKYAILNGPGGQQINKPKIISNSPLTKEIEYQF
ncbi:1521_t:CDS:2 [Scutellospora calospora]|uniref:1521_t:CDS:1 n=1 Tax=Scutellospora calospora TaxID=85575 RepID=A0ACA9KT17_9GLOM|nr:1521_t:CDS:2 [Scutellospora calospora]